MKYISALGHLCRSTSSLAVLLATLALTDNATYAATDTWSAGAGAGDTTWSNSANWVGGVTPVFSAGDTFDLSTIALSAAGTSTVDSGMSGSVLGTIQIGTTTGTQSWTLNGSSGASFLELNGNGSDAKIIQTATSGGDSISVALSLDNNLDLTNLSTTKALTISSAITDDTFSAGTTLISNLGPGNVVLSGSIKDDVNASGDLLGVVENSTTGSLTLGNAANAYAGGTTLTAGSLIIGSTTNAFGTGALNLNGGTLSSGVASAVVANAVSIGGSTTLGGTNAFTLSGLMTNTGTNTLAITNTAATTLSGGIANALGNTLTINNTGGALTIGSTGTVSGAGNLILNANNGSAITVSSAVNTTGTVTNSGTSTGTTTISGVISGASALVQNSATSQLSITGANTGWTGGLTIDKGNVVFGTTAGASGTGTITLGSASGGSASLWGSVNGAVTLANNITLATGAVGTLTLGGGPTSGAGTGANLTVSSASTLTLNGNVLNINDQGAPRFENTNFAGAVTLAGTIAGGSGSGLNIGLVSGNIYSAGTTTISGNNTATYSGTTTLEAGALKLGNAGALGTSTLVIGGGAFGTFVSSGYTIPTTPSIDALASFAAMTMTGETWNSDFTFVGTNALNLGTGAISLGTSTDANRLVNVAASTLTIGGVISNGTNGTDGLVKNGAGTLILNGADAYTGGTTINGGILQFGAGAVPSTGLITINNGGSLNMNLAGPAPYTTVAGWLGSGLIAAGSTGDIALTGANAENLNFTGYTNLMLGASGTATYTGTITPGSTGYHLGGGGGTLILSGVNALTGSNNLTIGAVSVVGVPVVSSAGSTLGASTGTVELTAADNLSGATALNAGTLYLSGASGLLGSLANSAITVNNGATLAIDSNGTGSLGTYSTTRAASLTLDGATLTDTTYTTNVSIVSTDIITGALTLNTGANTIQVQPNGVGGTNELEAGSLVLGAHSFALVNGVNLGLLPPANNSSGNIIINSFVGGVPPAGVFVGSTQQTTGGINTGQLNTAIIPDLAGVVSTVAGGTLNHGAVGTANTFLTYDTTTGLRPLALTEFNSNSIVAGDNTYITTATTSSAAGTTSINSLLMGAATLTIADGTTLNDASGALLFSGAGTIGLGTLGTGKLDFGANTAYIDTSSNGTINVAITGSGGLVKTGAAQLSLNGSNTYTGNTYVLNGTLSLAPPGSSNTGQLPVGSTVFLGDTGGSNSATLRFSGSVTNAVYTYANNIVVQGGNTGTSEILFPTNIGVNSVLTGGAITLGSANAAGTVVGHNLTIDFGSASGNGGTSVTDAIVDPTGLTGPGGVLTIIEDITSNQTVVFGSANSTYSGGTVIQYANTTFGFTPKLQLNSGSIFGSSLVTINGGTFNEVAGITNITGSNNQIWNADWTLNTASILNWGMTGSIDLGNIASGTVRTINVSSGASLIVAGNIQNGSNGVTDNLAFSGAGAGVLTGTDTYTGTTTMGGTLQLGSGGTTGSIANNTGASLAVPTTTNTLVIDRSDSQTLGAIIGNNGIVSGAGNFTQAGEGTVTIAAAQTYTGTTTISGGGGIRVAVNSGGSLNGGAGTALTFNANGGTFNFDNTGSTANNAQAMGLLTNNAGEDTIESTYGTSGNDALTFSNVTTRPAGTAVNFVDSGGTITGATPTNKIVLTQINGAATPVGTLLNKGYFFDGSSYAAYDANGYVRAYNYSTDTGGITTAGGATFGTVTSSNNVQMTGAVTAQNTATINTLNISGANNLTMANTNSTVLSVLGILKSGGNAATIASGTGTGEFINNTGLELMIRADQSSDSLTILSAIEGAGGVTKSGAGTLALDGANTYTGVTTVDAGTLDINNAAALGGGTAALILNEGSTIDNTSGAAVTEATNHTVTLAGDFTFGGTNALNLGTGAISLGANDQANRTITTNGTAPLTLGGVISNGTNGIVPTTGLIEAGTGSLILAGANTYTGGTTVNGGTLYANNSTGSGTGTGGVMVNNGGTFGGTGTIAPTTGGLTNAVTVNTGGIVMPGGVQPLPSPTAAANGNLTLDPTNVTGGSQLFNATVSTNATSPSLVFALGATSSSSKIVVAGTASNIMNFNVGGNSGTSTVVAINDLIGGGLTLNQNYVLIQGNGNTVFLDNGQVLQAGNADGLVAANGLILGGLQLLAPNTPGNFFSQWYNTSELFLVGNNIEVEVIPEPSTWALILSGFTGLVFFQRRRSKRS